MYVLMNRSLDIKEVDAKLVNDINKMVKEKFADGVLDKALKRELIRLNDERPTMELQEMKDYCHKWLGENDSSIFSKKSADRVKH